MAARALFTRIVTAVAATYLVVDRAHADAPLNYLRTYGLHADRATTLLWVMMGISIAVVIIVTALLLAGLFRAREPAPAFPSRAPIERASGGLRWITIGVGVTTVVLFGVTVWTVVVLAAVARSTPAEASPHIEVIGHQWWWEVRYVGDNPSHNFITANEIHIPVGPAVRITLRGVDVIHSFWVPALAGKTDVIPGQVNTTWLQAQRPGVYRGQCTEYCGKQHANMALQVIASDVNDFTRWWNDQIGAAPAPIGAVQRGRDAFLTKCAVCHTVRGTRAGGILGPDLTHLMARRTIAAGTLPNTPGYLSGWIANPQHVKPGNLMPNPDLTGSDLVAITAYLQTLR